MKRWRRAWRRSAAMIGSQGWRESVGGGRADRARSEADGIYKMAGTRWRIAARNQRPEQDSRNPGNADATVEPAGRWPFPWPRWPRYEQETVGLSHSCALRSEPVYNVSVQGL
jgi:hypothetical protein